jgi:hypothetical protein
VFADALPDQPGTAETCTGWNITYVVSVAADGRCRIVRGTDLLSQPC